LTRSGAKASDGTLKIRRAHPIWGKMSSRSHVKSSLHRDSTENRKDPPVSLGNYGEFRIEWTSRERPDVHWDSGVAVEARALSEAAERGRWNNMSKPEFVLRIGCH